MLYRVKAGKAVELQQEKQVGAALLPPGHEHQHRVPRHNVNSIEQSCAVGKKEVYTLTSSPSRKHRSSIGLPACLTHPPAGFIRVECPAERRLQRQ